MQDFLLGLGNFGLYFAVSLLALLAFKLLYTLVTPYDEWALVKAQNGAAALSLSGAVVGFSLALGSAARESISIADFAAWGVVALLAQILAFVIVRVLFMPKITQRIEDNEWPAGALLGAISLAVGVLNGACMSY